MVLSTGLMVDSGKDATVSQHRTCRNSQDKDNACTFDLAASEGVSPVYDPVTEGTYTYALPTRQLPICIQLVGRIWQDPLVFTVATKIDEALRRRADNT